MYPTSNNPTAKVCPYAHPGRGSHQIGVAGLFPFLNLTSPCLLSWNGNDLRAK